LEGELGSIASHQKADVECDSAIMNGQFTTTIDCKQGRVLGRIQRILSETRDGVWLAAFLLLVDHIASVLVLM
jgi:hypothetical protein